MLVVADSSPIITLVKIDRIELLPKLFQQVFVPPAVAKELADNKRPAICAWIETRPSWLQIKAPKIIEPLPGLHPGESEAISLALETSADLVLIDERCGYRAAKARGLAVVGFLGILERSARDGLIDLNDAFDRLRRDPTIWVSHRLLERRLEHFRKTRGGV